MWRRKCWSFGGYFLNNHHHRTATAISPTAIAFRLGNPSLPYGLAGAAVAARAFCSPAAPAEEAMSFSEAKRLMRLVNVESLKRKLGTEGKEVISYGELLEACESIGVARSSDEAATFARILDEAGVVLLFRDKVYLHPDKVKKKNNIGVTIILFDLHFRSAVFS